MNKRIMLRDFALVNILGGAGAIIMFIGMLLQNGHYLPRPKCAFLHATHMYCPGCGGTRALFSMLKGHIWASICYNPAVVLGAVLIIYYEVTVIMTICSRKGRIYYARRPWPVYIYVCIVLLFAIVRDVLLVVYGIDLLG